MDRSPNAGTARRGALSSCPVRRYAILQETAEGDNGLVLCLLTHENCPAASGPLLKRTDFICGFLGAAWCDAAAVHAYGVSYHVWTEVASKCTAHDL